MAQANLEIVLRQQPLEKAKHPTDILQNQMGDAGQTGGTHQQHQHRKGNPVLPAAGDKRHQRQDAKEQCGQPDDRTRQRSDEGSGAQDEPCQQDNGHRMIFRILLRIEIPPQTVFSWSVESSWFIMPSSRLTFS